MLNLYPTRPLSIFPAFLALAKASWPGKLAAGMLLFLLASLLWQPAGAQVSGVFITPAGATAEDSITITLDPALLCTNNTPGLQGAGIVRLHAGVALAGVNWQNVVTAAPGADNALVGFTKTATGSWAKKLKPRDYFSVPSGTAITALCFVLNGGPNGQNWALEGKQDKQGCNDFIIPFPLAGPIAGCEALTQRTLARSGPANLCNKDSVILSVATVPGGTYQWLRNGQRLDGATLPTLIIRDSASYVLYIADSTTCGRTDTVATTLQPAVAQPSAIWANLCGPGRSLLQGLNIAPTGGIAWYDSAKGTVPISTALSFTSPLLTDSTWFYFEATQGRCRSQRLSLLVEVIDLPRAATATDSSFCAPKSFVLSVRTPPEAQGLRWYADSTSTTWISIDNFFRTGIIDKDTTFWVNTQRRSCESAVRVPLRVNKRPAGPQPTASDVIICAQQPATIVAAYDASITTASYVWYSAPTGGQVLSTSKTYTTGPLPADTAFYVAGLAGPTVCPSARLRVRITANPTPAAPTATGTERCGLGPVQLIVNPAPNTVTFWYSAATGGNLLKTGDTLQATAGQVVYVESLLQNCKSASRAQVSTKINALPAQPTVTRFGNTLRSTYTTGNQWYSAAAGLLQGQTDASFGPSQDGTYYVIYTDGKGCSSQSDDFVLTITSIRGNSQSATLRAHPNPVTTTVVIDGLVQGTCAQLLNALGKVVKNVQVYGPSVEVDLSVLPAGLYMFKNGNQTARLVKE